MCRLFALTSKDPVSPILAVKALDVMKEGHDGSGVGLLLQDLGVAFQAVRRCQETLCLIQCIAQQLNSGHAHSTTGGP